MFSWFANSRRKKLIQEPFPSAWEDILHSNVAHYCMLDDAERTHLRELIQVFVAERIGKDAAGWNLPTKSALPSLLRRASFFLACLTITIRMSKQS